MLVATALKLYAREEIDSLQLQRINYAIDRFMLCNIDVLRSCPVDKYIEDNDPLTANCINSGLVYISTALGGGVYFNETARLFLRVLEEGLR